MPALNMDHLALCFAFVIMYSRYRKGVGIIACDFHVFAVDPSDFVTPLFFAQDSNC